MNTPKGARAVGILVTSYESDARKTNENAVFVPEQAVCSEQALVASKEHSFSRAF